MKKKQYLSVIILALYQFAFGQINQEESSAQIIGYWDLDEKQSYTASYSKYKVQNLDTTYSIKCNYMVDVSIKDSTATSYTIEWLYRDYKVEAENELIKKLSSIAENIKVIFKTDELGVFQEVLNWEEIRNYFLKTKPVLQKEFVSIPNINQILDQVFQPFTTKEGIENNAIKDIKQFYTFHGGKYILDEKYEAQLFTANNYFPEKPFDTKVEVSLDELNFDDDNCVIRSYQVIDSKQLTEATFQYLNSLANINGSEIQKSNIPPISNETWVASRIHGGSGWIIYSLLSKEVTAENITSVEETVLEIN